VESWLIDTALFESLAPGGPQKTDSFRQWIETHEDPVFLSAASIHKIEAAIERIPASQGERVDGLTKWLDALITNFSDRIHPLDGKVYTRASYIMRHWQPIPIRVRYHDVLLAATAQVYGHGLLTDRVPVFDFGPWASVKVASP
jgi:predicted nucleic acid-binding protein